MRLWLMPMFVVVVAASCVKQATHQRALADNAKMRQQHAEIQRKLVDQIDVLQGEIVRLTTHHDSEVARLGGEKRAIERQLADWRRQKDAVEDRIVVFRALQDKLRALVDTRKVQMSFRHGQVTLELDSRILFPSGSADLSKTGQAALREIVKILVPLEHHRFVVSGARAISVVQFMIQQQFPANNLAAAGYAEHDRELNRPLEIIIEELPALTGVEP